MTATAPVFHCSICGELSTDICVYCTKDTCINHRCDRCKRCSDCCECEIPLSAAEEPAAEPVALEAVAPAAAMPVEAPAAAETAAEDILSAVTPEPETIAALDSIWAPEPIVQSPIFEPQPPEPADTDAPAGHYVVPPAEENKP